MAIGVSLMLNIKLPANFNSPYKAKDIQDFWRRWHITLSKFLRDYIYIPLGGNRVSSYRNSFNLFSVFLIGGLWHGASWMFVLWGALHGIAMVIHRIWKDIGFKMNSFMAWFITFNFINITWVFFRAKHWDDALKVLGGMVSGELILPEQFHQLLHVVADYCHFGEVYKNIQTDDDLTLWLILGFVTILSFKNSTYMQSNFKHSFKTLILFIVFMLSAILNLMHVSKFLYFNF